MFCRGTRRPTAFQEGSDRLKFFSWIGGEVLRFDCVSTKRGRWNKGDLVAGFFEFLLFLSLHSTLANRERNLKNSRFFSCSIYSLSVIDGVPGSCCPKKIRQKTETCGSEEEPEHLESFIIAPRHLIRVSPEIGPMTFLLHLYLSLKIAF